MTSGGSGRGQVAAAVAVALAVLSGGGVPSAEAAGLGRLTVQSALGQPLRAEVEVTAVSADEADTLTAKIASPEAFSRVGLQYKEALSGVRMAVENRGGRYFIKVTSSKPINDPFVDLVVELSWASGTFSREYTFLLDPPVQQKASQASRSGNAPVAGAATASGATGAAAGNNGAVRTLDPSTGRLVSSNRNAQQGARAGSDARKEAAAQGPAGRDAQSEGGVVTVGRGETLGMIARRVRPASATLDQTIVAIYRTNPNSFIQNNPNLIREGRELTIPSEGEIAAIDSAEAGRQLRMAARDFRTYKERMAGAVPEVKSNTGGTTASGAVSAQVDDARNGAEGSSDRLELSRSEGTKDGKGVGVRDAEAQVARDAALKEANSRIAELEKNVGALKSMLELKDKSLADLQAQLDKARAAGAQVSGTVAAAATAAADKAREAAGQVTDKAGEAKTAAEKAVAEKAAQTRAAADKLAADAKAASDKLAAEKKAAEDKAAAEKKAAEEKQAAGKAAADKAAADKAAADKAAAEKATADAKAIADGKDQQAGGDEKSAAEKAAADAKAEVERVTGAADTEKHGENMPKPAPVNEGEREGEGSFIDGLSQNSMLLPGLGVAAVVAGLGFWMMRRRRREDDGFSDSISADEFTANSLFGTTGGQSVDTMTGASTQITTISEATPTEVDPIAEAEVYIAYGRETQAEEILREALKRQPERQAIRLKLLEIFSGRKDTVAFSQMAREMHDMTGGLNEEWSRVVSMGAALDPDNPLYGDGWRPAPPPPAVGADGGRASRAAAAAAGVAGAAAAVDEPAAQEAEAAQPAEQDNGLQFEGAATAQAHEEPAHAEAQPATFQSTRSGPLSAMPSVELPSLDLDAPLDMDDGPSTVTDLNIDTTITESLDMGDHTQGASDLGSIGLDLSPSTISGPITMSGAASSQWQEMASKLDLASAYVEIGDKEGARELLEEVLQGGDASQQQRARDLLADL